MSNVNGSAGGRPDVTALREEIRQTRADLGETVQALAAKADVKARAREQVAQTKQRARVRVHDASVKVRSNPVPFAAALVAGAALVGVILIVRGRLK